MLIGVGLALWVSVVALGRAWGLLLHERGRAITLYTPPVLGGYRTSPPSGLVIAAGVAIAIVAWLPRWAATATWRRLVVVTTASAAAWGAALAAIDGADGFTRGLEWEREWQPHVGAAAADPVGFLRGYVDRLPEGSVQLRGHPPGFALFGAALDRIGVDRPGAIAAVVLLAGLSAVVAVLLTTRLVVGESAARRIAPFVALSPAATWLVTAPDTLFVAVTAWFVFLLVVAMRSDGRRAYVLAGGAGLLAAAAALLSYGMVLVACIALGAALLLRGWRAVAIATGVAFAAVGALAPLGFWWFSGLAATQHEYHTLDVDRPYSFFLVANLSAWALAIGPATVVGFLLLRDRRAWALAGGALAAALVANVSGLSEGEVERIWLPFTAWASVAAVALPTGPWASRLWLSLQALVALGLAVVVETYW